jgi:hypothetical protein
MGGEDAAFEAVSNRRCARIFTDQTMVITIDRRHRQVHTQCRSSSWSNPRSMNSRCDVTMTLRKNGHALVAGSVRFVHRFTPGDRTVN